MTKRTTYLPILPFREMIKKETELRASRDASEELREQIENIAKNMVANAAKMAIHAKRKTLEKEDIKLANSIK